MQTFVELAEAYWVLDSSTVEWAVVAVAEQHASDLSAPEKAVERLLGIERLLLYYPILG